MRIEKLTTSGTFDLDGQSFAVDNNVWLIGDDTEVIIVDPAHSPAQILRAVGDRTVKAIIATHGHNDHITAAKEISEKTEVPVYLHPGDEPLWKMTYSTFNYVPLADGQRFHISGSDLTILHTPGHSPGSVAVYAQENQTLFSGDTLFSGGPGATGRSYSNFSTIIASIRDRILALPAETLVFTGHGDATEVGVEAPYLEKWIARGH